MGNRTENNYNKYKKETKRVKEQVFPAQSIVQDIKSKMEDISGNQKLFYKIQKIWERKTRKIVNIEDEKGIMKKSKGYFQELLQTEVWGTNKRNK